MSTGLSLCDAARRSNLGLSGLMKAIRSGELAASRGSQGDYVVSERDLNRFLKSQERATQTARISPAPIVPAASNRDAQARDALNLVRTAFGAIQPDPQPQPAEPTVPPTRNLGQWCDSYLGDLRKAEWLLRKLEADAEWLNVQLQRDETRQPAAEESRARPGGDAGKSRLVSSTT